MGEGSSVSLLKEFHATKGRTLQMRPNYIGEMKAILGFGASRLKISIENRMVMLLSMNTSVAYYWCLFVKVGLGITLSFYQFPGKFSW